MAKVKGSTFVPRLNFMLSHDPGGYRERVMQQVPAACAQEIEKGMLTNQWYPLEWYVELNRAIDLVFGQGDMKLVWELGRVSADEALKGIYKVFYRVGSPEFIIKSAAVVWKQYYDCGQLQISNEPCPRGKKIRVAVKSFETPTEIIWMAVGGWIERTLELSGGRNVKIEISRTRVLPGTDCEYVCTWE